MADWKTKAVGSGTLYATDLNVLLAMADRLQKEGREEEAEALRRVHDWIEIQSERMRRG